MPSDESCIPPISNIAATSAGYAQMTGLLAGFAFTALVMLLAPTQVEKRAPREQAQAAHLFIALFAAFVALLLCTLTYCVLAGEDVEIAPGRAAAQELVDGLPFGLAFIVLFHGLALLLDYGSAHGGAGRTVHTVSVLVLPVTAMFYLTNAVPDMESARATVIHGCPDESIYNYSLILTATCLAVLIATLIAKRRWPPFRDWNTSHQSIPPILVLVICVVATVLAGHLSSQQPNFLISRTWMVVYLEATWFLLTGIGVLFIATWPGEDYYATPQRPPTQRAASSKLPKGFWFTPGQGKHSTPRYRS